jgi:Ni,Fe-hydrogenase III component G
MTSTSRALKFEMIFGSICSAPEAVGSSSLVEARVSQAAFEKLLDRWRELPGASRPRLRGLAKARSGGTVLQLVLEAEGPGPFLLLLVEWEGSRAIPSLTEIWPYAAWWEGELRAQEGLEVKGESGNAGVAWRQN